MRACRFGIELEPKYVNLALGRAEAQGLSIERASDG